MTDHAYTRISFDSKVSGSIDKQRARLARHAHNPIFYEERSVSGAKVAFEDRPEGAKVLAALVPHDRVLVTRIDRAARNVRDLLDLVERIERAECSIVFVDQSIDTSGPMGRFLLTLLGAIAELEAGIVAERRRESLAQFKVEGRHAVGRAPFGLRATPNPGGRGLVLRPDEEELQLLRAAVAGIFRGDTQQEWAERAGMGAPAFGRLLRNERLAGILDGASDPIRLDPEMAIFSLAEWRRLQTHLRRPAKPHRSRAGGYGRAFECSVCGERMYLNLSKRSAAYSTYKCRLVKHEPGQPSASVTRVNADAHVEAEFLRRFGYLPVVELVMTDSSAVRDEAVALAHLQLDAIRDAQDAAVTDEEEDRTHTSYLKAKRALRNAEALPTEAVTEEVLTGETFAQVWAEADDERRTTLLLHVGPWVVEPGRLPIEAKVHLPEAEPDYLAGQND